MISFVIPVYNGAGILKENIGLLTNYFNKNSVKNYELVLVNDGSTDNIDKIVKSLANKKIKLVGYFKNKGKGYALKCSSRFVRGKNIIFIDLDLPSQVDLKVIEKIIYYLKKYDIVIGSRCLKESNVKRRYTRLLLSKLYRLFIVVFIHNLNISDTDFGLKGFKANTFNSLNNLIKENGWSWDLEMLILARIKKIKIKELPVSHKEDGLSTFGNLKGPLNQLISTLRVKLRYINYKFIS